MCMSDVGRILELSEDGAEAIAWTRGAARTISTSVLTLEGSELSVGDWVVVSMGLAIERLSESAAHEMASMMGAGRR